MAGAATTVLDFDPREADQEAAARTRRLLGRVLAAQGPAGLARALHVPAARAAQLKHRVACVTCRSRLDALASSLAESSALDAAALAAAPVGGPEPFPAPLGAWLASGAGRGLEPAPRALRDPAALAAFLAAFGSGDADGADAAGGGASGSAGGGRRSGRAGGVDRCPHHAPRTGTAGKAAPPPPGGSSNSGPINSASSSSAAVASHAALTVRERERYVAILQGSTTDSEWRQLGAVDIDSAMCDLFAWLGERGLCSFCADAVTGALLEVRRAVTGACSCSRCMGFCGARKALKDGAAAQAARDGVPALPPPAAAEAPAAAAAPGAAADEPQQLAVAGDTPPPTPTPSAGSTARPTGGPPELLRVQGQLRAICGIYRLEALPFNGRPVYKKERAEAYLLYTSLKDWMVSGRADAGGSRCEGWAYVTDPAKTPDEVCGVWKVSGPRGWEEDPTLSVTVFEGLPEELRAGLGYDDGSFIARRLSADDRGVLLVPLQEPEVLQEVLWAPDEPPPTSNRSGACLHITTAEMAQRELRCWLRWLLRDRLDAQRRRVLAQAQVGAALCRLFACAALQQLEQAAEEPTTPATRSVKKGRAAKKGSRPAVGGVALLDAQDMIDEAGPPSSCASASALLDQAAVPTSSTSTSTAGEVVDTPFAPSSPLSASTLVSKKSGAGCGHVDSDESASTRASSEEPPDAHRAELALGARRLMEQMGWRAEATTNKAEAIGSTEVAAWMEQHPSYRQAVREERAKLKMQFQKWAGATVR